MQSTADVAPLMEHLGFSKQAEIVIFPYCLVDYVSPMKGHLSSLTFLKAKFLFSILSGNLPKRLLTYYLSTTNAFKFFYGHSKLHALVRIGLLLYRLKLLRRLSG